LFSISSDESVLFHHNPQQIKHGCHTFPKFYIDDQLGGSAVQEILPLMKSFHKKASEWKRKIFIDAGLIKRL